MNDKELQDRALKFMKETEGKRPAVNDPRAGLKTRDKLNGEEINKQAKVTEAWAKKLMNR